MIRETIAPPIKVTINSVLILCFSVLTLFPLQVLQIGIEKYLEQLSHKPLLQPWHIATAEILV
jgi:hypothetical protein